MSSTKIKHIKKWSTFHDNGPYPSKRLLVTTLTSRDQLPSKVDRYNDAAKEIQRQLKLAVKQGEGFRALGATWSLSNIAHHHQRMLINIGMKLRFVVRPQEVHHTSPYQHANLFFFECGNTIKQISEFIHRKGKSLKTTGASNGQTIAGCISTGVHGSALDVGSVQDYVVGLNLIIGPKPRDIVYLERHSRPALTDAYVQQFNARVIRNDDLFNAALVGLGAFGFIHGVVIDTEDRFLLKRYVVPVDRAEAIKIAETMNFENTQHIIPKEIDATGKGLRPYHYKLFINPYNDDEKYVVEFIYKKPYRSNYPNPLPRIKKAVYTDLITLFTKVIGKFPKVIPFLIKQLSKSGSKILPKVDTQTLGTIKETFWDAQHAGPAFACSVGIDHKDAGRALKVLTDLTRKNPIPGIYAMRFIKASEGTLAFSQWPITCMLEVDGVLWKGTKKLISLDGFAKKMLEVLVDNNIKFTLHWGKNADWGRPGLSTLMYGPKAKSWMDHRSALLTKQMCKVFSNDFLKTVGLDKHTTRAPRDFVTNMDFAGNPVV